METARERGLALRYEATAGAGLPVLDTLAKLQEAGDRVETILGASRGTLGFIMTALEDGKRVQRRGARGVEARLHRARSARRPLRHRRRAQGADPRAHARTPARAERHRARVALHARASTTTIPRASSTSSPRSTTRSRSASRARNATARCCATSRKIGKRGISVGVEAVDRGLAARPPAAAPTTRSSSTPSATTTTRSSSPAPAPARTSPRPAC